MQNNHTESTRVSHPAREPVLVLAHSDGFIEVYAARHVDVLVKDVPMTSTPAAEILAEDWITETIPWRYREIYYPGARRAMHTSRPLTVEDIAARQWRLEFLHAIEAIGDLS